MINLKTLKDAQAQEVFDQVVNHLLEQNQRSIFESSCVYFGPGGIKCAAGCLISDDEYVKDMEGNNWSEMIGKGYAPLTHGGLIKALQVVHDSYNPVEWKHQLDLVATTFDLDNKAVHK